MYIGREIMDTTEAVQEELPMAEEVTEEEKPALNAFMLSNGFPLFLGEVDDIIDRVKELGYNIFYVLGTYVAEYEVQNDTTKTTRIEKSPPVPRVFRVTVNNLGYAVDTVDADALGLVRVEPSATMNLEKIPFELIQKIDAFFRAVDKKNYSEAIVLFTYDPIAEGSGWGILVPKQKNTGTHCKYDPPSVVDELTDLNEGREFDEQIFIAGTAHSHPGMSAYASHTDEGDQKNFDGIHITFGWRHGSNATEHHVELQMGGTSFALSSEAAFTDAPEPPNFPEVEVWINDKVTKATYTSSYNSSNFSQGYGSTGATFSPWQGYDSSRDSKSYYDQNQKPFKLPEGCPDIKTAFVVARLLSEEEAKCPVCQNPFHTGTKDKRRCWDCMCYVLFPGETVDDIVEIRQQDDAPTFDLRPERASKDILVWEREIVEDNALGRKIETSVVTYHEVDKGKG
jgi:hypothetical protein